MTARARARAPTVAVQDVSNAAKVPSAARLRMWAKKALGTKARGELTVRIVTVAESAELNSRYRSKQGPTNVLSFSAGRMPDGPGADLLPLGDLVICAEVVQREAREQGKASDAHWAHMVIHGTLHLQGYDHENRAEAATMEAHERLLLAELGFPDPYSV
jgi:probable rRNA maturation factor